MPRFEEVRDALSLHEGFVLLPVEVPSADVGRALASWLSSQGHPVRVVAPSAGGWSRLPAELVAAPAGQRGLVVVIGPREVDADLRAGLRLLNQRRDTVAAHLGAPLLWCGPRPFLDAAWELAPDFWSIRELPIRIPAQAVERVEAPGTAEGMPLRDEQQASGDPPEALRELLDAAKQQGDRLNAARLALRLARELFLRSEYIEAKSLVGQALSTFQAEGDQLGQANVLKARGDLRRFQDDLAGAGQDYDEALQLYEAVEDRLGQANVLKARGDLAQGQGDLATALPAYLEALKLYQQVDNALGRSNVLAEIARVHARAGRPDQARAAAEQAAALAEKSHNAYARKLAAAVLAALADA